VISFLFILVIKQKEHPFQNALMLY